MPPVVDSARSTEVISMPPSPLVGTTEGSGLLPILVQSSMERFVEGDVIGVNMMVHIDPALFNTGHDGAPRGDG